MRISSFQEDETPRRIAEQARVAATIKIREGLARGVETVLANVSEDFGEAFGAVAFSWKRLEFVEALALIDVKVLDHIVVSGDVATSFAERGVL